MTLGRPAKFTDVKDMQRRIELYFLACKVHQLGDTKALEDLSQEELLIINDIDDVFPTVTGLGLALGMTRQTLIEYQNEDEFSDTVKKAKQRVENAIEQRLFHNNATGSIFNLKNNFNWKDKTENESYGKNGGAIEQSLTVRYVDGKDE